MIPADYKLFMRVQTFKMWLSIIIYHFIFLNYIFFICSFTLIIFYDIVYFYSIKSIINLFRIVLACTNLHD